MPTSKQTKKQKMSLNYILERLVSLPRWQKRALVFCLDVTLCAISVWLSFCLRYDEFVQISYQIQIAFLISLFLFIPTFVSLGIYRPIYRFSGWFVALPLIRASSVYGLGYLFVIFIVGIEGIPRSIGLIQPALFCLATAELRIIAKILFKALNINKQQEKFNSRALIYGAGMTGRQLASALRYNANVEPMAFIDHDCKLWGGMILGLPVYSPDAIPNLIKIHKISDVLVALPNADIKAKKKIFASLSDLPLHIRDIPDLMHFTKGNFKLDYAKEVRIEDVLGRDPIPAIPDLLEQAISDKIVMVTGAGGSIGSELCRQIIKNNPVKLILLELNEYALYKIEMELNSIISNVEIISILGSVTDINTLKNIFNKHSVDAVYHSAAYKHVPIIEMNPTAGVFNNVFGTLRLVDACCSYNIKNFVLISTDKAVNPVNIMGCSKRVSELIVQAKDKELRKQGQLITTLTMVRFGNVLGSSGSVVPLFQKQIKHGGPVTVTHPDIVRYFMTLSEAAQLVIQATAIGEGGDVMLLDMGDPVSITDLAKKMIHLSGYSYKDSANLDGEIEIKFTGLRCGEKLYEELLVGNNSSMTIHPRIMRATEKSLSWNEIEMVLSKLEKALTNENLDEISWFLQLLVPEFEHAMLKSSIIAKKI